MFHRAHDMPGAPQRAHWLEAEPEPVRDYLGAQTRQEDLFRQNMAGADFSLYREQQRPQVSIEQARCPQCLGLFYCNCVQPPQYHQPAMGGQSYGPGQQRAPGLNRDDSAQELLFIETSHQHRQAPVLIAGETSSRAYLSGDVAAGNARTAAHAHADLARPALHRPRRYR